MKSFRKEGPWILNFLLEVYQKQAKIIYYYLRKNGCSHEDAEDVVQESYMKFIVYSSGVPSDKALSYIFTISINEFRKMLKKKGKERVLTIDDNHFGIILRMIKILSPAY